MRALAPFLVVIVAACSPAPVGEYKADPRASDDTQSGGTDASAPVDAGASAGPSVTLTVTLAGSGTGAVMSTPSGLVCQDKTCTGSFPAGTTVGLVPAPGAGSSFAGWGGACSGSDTCTPKVTADTSVTATFETLAGTYSGPYTHSAQLQGCTFNNKGTLTITVTPDGTAFASTGTITGLELRQVPGCNLVSSSATGTSPKEPMTLSGPAITGTWTFSIPNVQGQLALPYSATLSGGTLAGSWKCTGCTGQFSLTKK